VERLWRFHRSKRGLSRGAPGAGGLSWILASGAMCIIACNRDPRITTRAVTLHAPKSCVTTQTPLDSQAFVSFDALGDFAPPPQSAVGHLIGDLGAQLPEIQTGAQQLVVEATEADREWQGVGDVPATGDVDVLVTPSLTSCALTAPSMAAGSRPGAVLAPFGARQLLLVGGQPGSPPTSRTSARAVSRKRCRTCACLEPARR
jgi:hypothetical protein